MFEIAKFLDFDEYRKGLIGHNKKNTVISLGSST